jgi:hypothetical protein
MARSSEELLIKRLNEVVLCGCEYGRFGRAEGLIT